MELDIKKLHFEGNNFEWKTERLEKAENQREIGRETERPTHLRRQKEIKRKRQKDQKKKDRKKQDRKKQDRKKKDRNKDSKKD